MLYAVIIEVVRKIGRYNVAGRIEINASKWAGGAYLLRITSTAGIQVVRLSTH